MSSVHDFDCSKIISNGWKQGSFLLAHNGIFLDKNQNPLKDGLYMVISQDCDVVNHDLIKEPFVELLFMSEIQEEDGSFTNGKNPRKFHLQVLKDGSNKYLECLIYDKFFLSREHLANSIPISNFRIKDEDLPPFIQWIAKRYTRSAFPDAFNKRTRSVINGIKSILKNDGGESFGLFVRLNTDRELDESEEYKLILNILFHPKYSNDFSIAKFDSCLEKIEDQFSRVKGVALVQAQRLSIDELTYFEFLLLKKWDFDYISLGVNADGETL